MPYNLLSAPAGPFTQGVQYLYDPNLVQNNTTGMFRPVTVGDVSSVGIGDGANLDAFSRLRVSDTVSLFDSSFKYDLRPLLFYTTLVDGSSVTHDYNKAAATMTVGTGSTAKAQIQSKLYIRYVPAKSQFIAMTQIFGAGVANVVKRAGYFDDRDGIYFEQNGTTDIAVCIRTSTSGTPSDAARVAQSNWNVDKLDGTGPSRVKLDLSKAQILVIDFQWLGMGRVRIGFDIDGKILYCHEFLNANNLAVPYMQTSNLPVRWEIFNIGVSAGATMYATCSSVQSEGGTEPDKGFYYSASTPEEIALDVNRKIILAIRPTTGYNGRINRVQIQPQGIETLGGLNPLIVETWYNPTLSGGTWTAANQYSAVEWGTGQTASDLGTKIATVFVGTSNANQGADSTVFSSRRFPLCLDVSGYNPIALAITARSTNSNSSCWGEIEWSELS